MKHSFLFLLAASMLLASCSQSFKKSEGGVEYKIISDEKGKKIGYGNFFEISFDQTYQGSNKDTVLFTSKDYSNQIVVLDSAQIPPQYFKIFSQIRKGDSVIVRQLTDSLMKQAGGSLPPFMKKGAYIVAHYKIVNIFDNKEAADSAMKAQMEIAKARQAEKETAQLKKDEKEITDYLAKNKIQAIRAPMGTYVQILEAGEGAALDTSNVLKVNYTGRTMSDNKVFDSNTDSAFGHMQVFPVDLSMPPGMGVIKGWSDGLMMLKKKAKAILYIPSSLGYGAQGNGEKIKPNANLMFNVEVADVVTKAQAKAEEEVARKKMEAEQKRYTDSLQKAQNKKP